MLSMSRSIQANSAAAGPGLIPAFWNWRVLRRRRRLPARNPGAFPGTCPVAPFAGALGGLGLTEVTYWVVGDASREVVGNRGGGKAILLRACD